MNLSKKSRYGLTALIDLSIHSTKGHVSLISIAERNGISPQYLEHIFASLRRAGIIKSIKKVLRADIYLGTALHELQWHQLSKL